MLVVRTVPTRSAIASRRTCPALPVPNGAAQARDNSYSFFLPPPCNPAKGIRPASRAIG
jgi:hypothetical protein